MSRLPSSEPATTHLPCTSVVEKAANTQYFAFWWPAQHKVANEQDLLVASIKYSC